jgi:hypothetical protein
MKPSITFESWSAVNDEIGTLAECERKRMSGPWRVWEICVARANNYGHAGFRIGELAKLACGKDSPSNRDQVHRWLKTLGQMGRIDSQHSTPLCVMVNRDIYQRQAGKGSRKDMCSEPAHMDMRETPYSPKAREPAFTAPPSVPETPEDRSWIADYKPVPATSAPASPAKFNARQALRLDGPTNSSDHLAS